MNYKVASEDWFLHPTILGHKMAREQFVKFISVVDKYAKSDVQKALVSYVISDDIVTWNFWCNNITNKFVNNLRYVLRRIEGGNFTGLLRHHINNSGLLKDKLTWALEGLAATYDYDDYKEYYCSSLAFYGMREKEAVERLNTYINLLYKKDDFDVFMGTIEKIVKERR